jgi:predicted permease
MTWFMRLLRRRSLEEQMEKELRFHLEEHTAALIERGLESDEARRRARLELGGPEQVKEMCRDARGTRWLEDLIQDIRYALRTLRRQPGFLSVALLTLALGIGATTLMFTVVHSVLLKPLPYAEPENLFSLNERTEKAGDPRYGNLWTFSYPNFLDCQRECTSLAMAAWRYRGGTISQPGEAEYVDGFEISADLFPILSVSLAHGRTFATDEDQPGGAPAIILSHGLWQRRYGASPSTLGSLMMFDGKAYTIVGIASPDFRLDGQEADVFTPIGQNTSRVMQNRMAHPGISALARLRPGASPAEAQNELHSIGISLSEQYPDSNEGRDFVAQPLRADVGDVQSTLWLLLGAVSIVLLIACVNVASLLLARAVSRERELAVRVALGARRGRLVRQCLTESAVLGLLGGAFGTAIAVLGVRPFVALWPGNLPRAEEVLLDWQVLVFTLVVSLVSGLLFGMAPALRTSVRDLEQVLRAGSRTIAGASRRLHLAFVVSEIALAVVLLVAAGMLGHTLLRLSSLDPGLNIKNVLVARTALSPVILSNPQKTRVEWNDLLERARRIPGVDSVTLVDTVPMREGNNQIGYWTNAAVPPVSDQPLTLATSVTPDYLKVMGLRLLEGRFFDEQDRMGSGQVVVIDEVLAQSAFNDQDAIGKRLWVPAMGNDPVRVVGVVGHVRHWGLPGDDQARVRAQLYYPFAQVPDSLVRRWSELMSIAVKTSVAPLNVLEPLRRELRGATNDQVLYEPRTMEQLAENTLARHRFLLLLFSIFAGLALLLACIGIYGVLAYLTRQRIPEMGIRMALGATASDVLLLVLRQSIVMIAGGIVVGTVVAQIGGRLLQHLVEGMQPPGSMTFAITIPVLVIAALMASFLPAWRASRIDPVSALRQE